MIGRAIEIAKSARIHPTAKIYSFVVIEDDVEIGAGTEVGCYTIIKKGIRVGSNVKIEDHVVLGKQPKLGVLSTARKAPLSPLVIEDGCTVGAFSCIYAGSHIERESLVGDHATVRERVKIDEKSVVGRGVCVENDVTIGKMVRIQTGAYVTAHTTVEDYVFIAPMVTTTNDNFMGRTEKRFQMMKGATIKKGARVGANSIILPGIVIGEDSFVGAGSVVTRDVPAQKVVVGVPARVLRDVPEEELLENQAFYGKEE